MQAVTLPDRLVEVTKGLSEVLVEEPMTRPTSPPSSWRTLEAWEVVLGEARETGHRTPTTAPAPWRGWKAGTYITPDDVKTIAPPVIAAPHYSGAESELQGITAEKLIASILAAVPVPR